MQLTSLRSKELRRGTAACSLPVYPKRPSRLTTYQGRCSCTALPLKLQSYCKYTSVAQLRGDMPNKVETSTPKNTPTPIGPYNHIAKVGQIITIGGTAGVNPATGQLAGSEVYSQAKQIIESFEVMLNSVGSDLNNVIHVNVFLKNMLDFDEMNRAYIEMLGDHRPARTVIGVSELPKPGVLLTMNLTAVTRE